MTEDKDMTEDKVDLRASAQFALHAGGRCYELMELLRETFAALQATGVEIDEDLAADIREAIGGQQ